MAAKQKYYDDDDDDNDHELWKCVGAAFCIKLSIATNAACAGIYPTFFVSGLFFLKSDIYCIETWDSTAPN